jgi:TRAP-type C4-dicarboxylate transport system substrate-binding protein
MHAGARFTILFLTVLTIAGACTSDAGNGDKAGGVGDPVVLQMANTYGDLGQLPSIAYFVERVGELSGGNVRIEVIHDYGDFVPDAEQRVIEDVSSGDVQLGWVGTRVFDTMGVQSLQALTAPMLIDSYALQNAVIESGITKRMLADLDEVGVVGLEVLADGLRKPIGTAAPIVRPEDWRGLGFGTFRSDGQELAIRALGANPQVVFGPHREEAIVDGMIQGYEMGLHVYQLHPDWIRLAPYVTPNVSLWPQMDVLIANPGKLQSMTLEQRGWLEEAAHDAAVRSADLSDNDARSLGSACESGARFRDASPTELAALGEVFASVYSTLQQTPRTSGFIEEILSLKGTMPQEPALAIPSGCTGKAPSDDGTSAGTAPAFLNGVYRFTITKEDAIAAGEGGDPDYNQPVTLTVWLEDGSWKAQGDEGGNRGTYWVNGDRISFEWPSYDVVNTFTFTHDDEGTLTLTPVQPMEPGDAFLWSGKPWIKIR